MKRSKLVLVTVMFLLFAREVTAQNGLMLQQMQTAKWNMPKVSVRKSGPYIGYQVGQYHMIELGGEMQFKRIKLVHPVIHAARIGFAYDWRTEALNWGVAYWQQRSRVGLTFGASLGYHTDFTYGSVAIAPLMGFRLGQFHLQTGYYLLVPRYKLFEANQFFIALKFVLINHRDFKFDK